MEQEMVTPGRGSPESAAWFRGKLEELGMGQSALADWMIAAKDDRQRHTILRSIQRMASGDARVSGEMRALLTTLGTNEVLEQQLDLHRLYIDQLMELLRSKGIDAPARPKPQDAQQLTPARRVALRPA